LLRWMLALPARETRALAEQYQRTGPESTLASSGQNLDVHDQLDLAQAPWPRHQSPRAQAPVPSDPQARVRPAEQTAQIHQHRGVAVSATGVLQSGADGADPYNAQALYADYPVASLGENDDVHWLQLANKTLVQVFSDYLPDFCRGEPRGEITPQELPTRVRERRDQGLRRGYLATELLLSRFCPRRSIAAAKSPGSTSRPICDASCTCRSPSTLTATARRCFGRRSGHHSSGGRSASPRGHSCTRRLEHAGAAERIVLCYWLPTLRARLGVALPLSVLVDYCAGRLSRRQLTQQLGAFDLTPDAAPRGARHQRWMLPPEHARWNSFGISCGAWDRRIGRRIWIAF
jgi:hypothetical protein